MPYVNVHIDLDEIDDDELIDELKSRGYEVQSSGQSISKQTLYDYEARVVEIYDAFKIGPIERATDLVKEFVCEVTGRLL